MYIYIHVYIYILAGKGIRIRMGGIIFTHPPKSWIYAQSYTRNSGYSYLPQPASGISKIHLSKTLTTATASRGFHISGAGQHISPSCGNQAPSLMVLQHNKAIHNSDPPPPTHTKLVSLPAANKIPMPCFKIRRDFHRIN